MMKIKTTLATLLLAGFALCSQAQTDAEDLDAKYATNLVKAGTTAPDFTLKTPDGQSLSLSQFKGKTIVLDFWASWCPDCRKEAPDVVRLYNEFHSDKVEFIGISMDTNIEAWKKAIAQYDIRYPQASELKKFKETDISKSYGVQWIPSVVVVSPEGKVLLSTVELHKVEKLLKELK